MKTDLSKIAFCLALVLASSVYLSAGERAAKGGGASAGGARGPVTCPLPKDDPKGSADEPIAVVAGQAIYERDLADTIGAQMLQIHQQEYQVKSKALDELIRKKVVEIEGQENGVTYLRPTLPESARMVVTRGAQTLLSEEYKESIQLVEEGAKPRGSEAGKPEEK